jgi:hypothetical protein
VVFALIWFVESLVLGVPFGQTLNARFDDNGVLWLIGKMSVAGAVNSFIFENYYPEFHRRGAQVQRWVHLIG